MDKPSKVTVSVWFSDKEGAHELCREEGECFMAQPVPDPLTGPPPWAIDMRGTDDDAVHALQGERALARQQIADEIRERAGWLPQGAVTKIPGPVDHGDWASAYGFMMRAAKMVEDLGMAGIPISWSSQASAPHHDDDIPF